MAKSHKTCMEQALIIDTFGMYQAAAALSDPAAGAGFTGVVAWAEESSG